LVRRPSGVKTPEGSRLTARLKPCPDERQIGDRARWLLGKRGRAGGRGRKSKEPAGRPSFVRVNRRYEKRIPGAPRLRAHTNRPVGVAADTGWVSHLRRLASLQNYSQPLRAGLNSAAPTALKKREVERAGPSFLIAARALHRAQQQEGAASSAPTGNCYGNAFG